MDGFNPMDCGDDPFNLSALLSLDNYPELCSPLDYAAPPYSYSAFQQISSNWASSDIDTLASASANASDESMISIIPKYMPNNSLAERLLRALSLFKESSGGGILAQVWMPMKHSNGYILSTSEQPFLLDQILAGYREVSRAFTFSVEEAPSSFPGLPGRVFISGLPEWTSNVVYYNNLEYLRGEYALVHKVRGSLALPIFYPKERSCCAVLELVTTKEKTDFDMEMDSVCNALQAVELRSIKGQIYQQPPTKKQKSAFNEILDVLRACCHAHMLPLALTWIPFDSTKEVVCELNSSLSKKNLLYVEESACYVNDTRMKGFVHACVEHCLEKEQGIAGKALLSNHPFFSPDVKSYNIREYPLAHHARKYGLNAAVAIRLRSTLTGDDDYILEFFLPLNCRGSSEQQELLNNLSSTMQRICRSLRTVSDAEVVISDSLKRDIHKQAGNNSSSPEISIKNSQQMDSDNEVFTDFAIEDPNKKLSEQGDANSEQFKSGSSRQPEKKRSTTEKNISLSILQKYFSGSLKDAAKSIGVCPTTLKRICRQHGISRWPSRKINKVNRSLKKIQTVIDSVQGVEGALKYDPTSRCLVASVSTEKSNTTSLEKVNQDISPSSSIPEIENERLVTKLELDDTHIFKSKMESLCFPNAPYTTPIHQSNGTSVKTFEQVTAKSSNLMGIDDINTKTDTDTIKEHSHPTYSSMTDSSSGSASSIPTFQKNSNDKVLAYDIDNGSAITVKATYREDTVRFKFIPIMGCLQLLEEIGKRYKLSIGTFQLKYMDDEEEWVMLSSDADLLECVEVLESIGSRNLKLLVRDVQCNFGSSGGSNFLQT
ncbi:LOW QUALITY PROTEIN: protein NLP2-like [Asparagus officinalis]|uniref:LOW QUALITY PROTEIN: protein NLP2-like n=1 Tax=Asparagus officinalis TaxID=4686 RepID=UPI00098E67A0|nr:LOW QUALITY PROTEIN: protein NLP2-like [Asparagus officinalis]